jgi:hypothetical protein
VCAALIVPPGRAAAQEVVFSSGFEASEASQLDCVREGYPCSLADADPAALARVQTLLQEIWDVRHDGTLDDVRSYLENQPDVVEVGGNYRYVSFRVDGMSPAIFDDVTLVNDPLPEASSPTVLRPPRSKFDTARPARPEVHVKESGTTPGKQRSPDHPESASGRTGPVPRVEEVVGEDSNSDGKVDQKDIKRGLVMAPYEWQFAPNDESADLAQRLELLPSYTGNVVFKRNLNREDTNIVLEDWLALGAYDAVAISTHGSRDCEILPDLSNRCDIWISSGVEYDFTNPPPISLKGARISLAFDENDEQTPTYGRVALSTDFFRFFYAGDLDNQLVSFSACESGNSEGGDLAAAMGGDGFVMTGWTEVVPTSAAFPTMLAFYEELSKGLTANEAFDNISSLGLFPAFNKAGILTTFEVFSPRGDDVRLIELPRLMYEGSEMPEGVNIVDLVEGMVGDEDPDTLQLTVQIDGITPDSKPDFEVRYRVQDQEASGSYDLSLATLVGGYEYRYEVTHDVDLGFPLVGGETPIEVIVDLPEGGDSRYTTTAFLASCYFSADVSGDKTAFVDGPAQAKIGLDGSLEVYVRSRGHINGDLATSVLAEIHTGPGTPLVPGEYGIAIGSLSFTEPLYTGFYFPAGGVDCAGCGGAVTIEAVEEELSLTGSASLTMPRTIPDTPPGEEVPTVTLDVEFVAAFGSEFDPDSPYVQCTVPYVD